jgi:ATP-binding cassette subfamily B protein
MAETPDILTATIRRALVRFRELPRALGLIWSAAQGWTLAWLVLLVAQGLLPVATVSLTRILVDRIARLLGAGAAWPTLRPLIVPAALLAGSLLLLDLLRGVTGWIRTAQAESLRDHVTGLIQRQSLAADLAFFEWPEYYDHLHRARAEAGYRPTALLENLGSLLQNGITLLAMGVVLLPYGWWLPVLLVLSTFPALAVVLRFTFRQHQWRLRHTADERRCWYYDWVLNSGETAAEVRLFGLGPHFQALYETLRRGLRRERLGMAGHQAVAELGAAAIAMLATAGAMAWMIVRALSGRATLGDLALFYQAFQQGQRLMHSLLRNVGELYANSLFLGNLFEFLALRPQVVAPLKPVSLPQAFSAGIRFEHVSFRYPGSPRWALEDFSLAIPAGQLVALVGPNGAGKSTLVKLLCRFYDPDAGRITLEGIDLRDLAPEELRRRITVLFQAPVHYNATVTENIALGDLAQGRNGAIRRAARAAGAEEIVARLPRGYDQPLGHWFESGTELSVGEWQRIALARAFLRQAPIIALDEPTSAMDPWAEADWLARLRTLAAGRTALFITHRFTTALHADVIHVMEGGRIVESGCHRELLACGGRYARSWEAQTEGQPRSDASARSGQAAS